MTVNMDDEDYYMKYVLTITDYKVINPGEEGNKYGDSPVIGFWYETEFESGSEEMTAYQSWVWVLNAIQDNNENVINELELTLSPDYKLEETENESIKDGATVKGAIAYKLDDTTTPVEIVGEMNGDEVGRGVFEINDIISESQTEEAEPMDAEAYEGDSAALNYNLYEDENISVIIERISEDGAYFTVENRLDEPIYYTNTILAFDGFNFSDSAGLVFNSNRIAPKSTGRLLTELETLYTDKPSYIFGHAAYGTEDDSIEKEIDFEYGNKENLSNEMLFMEGTDVYKDENISVKFYGIDEEESAVALYYVHNYSDHIVSYVNDSIAINGISYGDEAGLVYNTTNIAPRSTAIVITEFTEDVDSSVMRISGSGGYYVEDIEQDIDFSYADIEVLVK